MHSGRGGLGGEEEEFVDILEERRRSSDLGHALRTFSPHPYRAAPSWSTVDLNKAVLESQYLRYVAKEVRRRDPKRRDKEVTLFSHQHRVSLCVFFPPAFLLRSPRKRGPRWRR